MRTSRDPAFAFGMSFEGGYSDDPEDNGNWSSGRAGAGELIGSNRGVTAPDLIRAMRGQVVTARTMRDLTEAQAEAIWSGPYWQALRCDDLPAGVDAMIVDFGYNAGDQTAAKELQALIGLTGDDVDGYLGDETLGALSAFLPRATGVLLGTLTSTGAIKALQSAVHAEPDGDIGPLTKGKIAEAAKAPVLVTCAALAQAQAARYRSLAQFPRYGTGWLNRTWARAALAMSLASGGNALLGA